MLRKQECQLHRSASRPAGLQLGGVAARPPAETLPCSNQHPGAEGTVGQAAHSLGLRLSGSAMGALYKRSIRLLLWPRTGERIWEAEVPGLGMRSGLLSHRILSPPLIEPPSTPHCLCLASRTDLPQSNALEYWIRDPVYPNGAFRMGTRLLHSKTIKWYHLATEA